MLFFRFLIVAFVLTISFAVTKNLSSNKQYIETFDEIEKNNMTRFDRYAVIIKSFVEVKGLKPSPHELHAFYDEFADKDVYSTSDVKKILENDEEYHRVMREFHSENNLEKDVPLEKDVESTTANKIIDPDDSTRMAKLVEKSYAKFFPSENLSNENKEFLMFKLMKFNYDIDTLEDYISMNEEYANIVKKRLADEMKMANGNSQKFFKISRPDVLKTTLETGAAEKEESIGTCQDLEDEQMLANLLNARNLDHLKYACLRSKDKFAKTDSDFVLIPELKWSVPQEQTGVCRKSWESSYNPSTAQTALIGTLLTDAVDTQVGTIMPEFEYSEKN